MVSKWLLATGTPHQWVITLIKYTNTPRGKIPGGSGEIAKRTGTSSRNHSSSFSGNTILVWHRPEKNSSSHNHANTENA